MIWFDSHFHIDPEIADRAPDIIASGREAGVGYFLVLATSMPDCPVILSYTVDNPGVYAAVGLHPHVAGDPYDLGLLRQWLADDKAKAVGEIGLDYFYDFSPHEKQWELFARQLDLAVELKLPAVIHSREAFDDTLAIVKDHLPKDHPFEIHSFTGTADEAQTWLDLGAVMSVNGMVTFKKADNVREILQRIPMDRLLVETDSPYLAPVPLRGKENTPATIPIIGQRIAQEKDLPVEDVARLTTENALRFFKIPSTLER